MSSNLDPFEPKTGAPTRVPSRAPRLNPIAGYGPVEARGWAPWTLVALVLALVFIIAGQLGALIPLFASGLANSETIETDLETELPLVLYSLAVLFGLTAILVLGWVKLVERRSLASIGLTRAAPLGRFLGGFGWGLAFLGVVMGAILLSGSGRIVSVGEAWSQPSDLIWIGLILLGFIVQGSTEEILTRGWLMTAIATRIGGVSTPRVGLVVAVLVSSALFTFLHGANPGALDQPLALVNIFAFAIFLAIYALREGGIWGACGWHAAWNWMVATGFEIEVSGVALPLDAWVSDIDAAGNPLLSGGSFGPEASAFTTAVLVLGCVIWGLRLAKSGLGARRDGLLAGYEGSGRAEPA